MRQNLKIEYIAPEVLIPYIQNAKLHPPEQVAQIKASINEFGFLDPIAVDGKNGIIAGHGRLLAALELELTEIPIIRIDSLSKARKMAYMLAHNKLTMNSGFNTDVLALELQALQEDDFDLSLTGFDQAEIDDILREFEAEQNQPEPDVLDEEIQPAKVVFSQPGDLYEIGEHRVICGDSTDAHIVEAVMGERKPNLMITDPPYGVEYDPEWRNKAARNSKGIGNRALGAAAVGQVLNDDKADWRDAWALFPGNIAYVWHAAGPLAGAVVASLEACAFIIRNQIIWAKNTFTIGRGDYHWQHEPCWYAVRNKGDWTGDRKQTTVWNIDKPLKSETGHSTQKPVECMARPMRNHGKPGDWVYDPFGGSGSTMVAAQTEGRKAILVELNPAYVDIIVRRMHKHFPRLPITRNGEAFDVPTE